LLNVAMSRSTISPSLYHVLCSDIDQAADWYERAINARDPFAIVFAPGPLGGNVRQLSRWPKLARIDEHAVSRSGAP